MKATQPVRVKICGIRTLADALAATDAGADMLGFNFYEASPRYIPATACRSLVDDLRKARREVPVLIGVFVNLPANDVISIVRACGLDGAQLSGDEEVDALSHLDGRGFKAIRPRDLDEANRLARAYRPVSLHARLPALLLDASDTGLYGGSGQVGDWEIARKLAGDTPFLLAGGLRPENVAEAVAAVQPWGVDVASGVESAPGVKDPKKMRDFVRMATR